MQTSLQKPELFKTTEIGSGNWLSVKDVQKLKSMYGCPSEHHAIQGQASCSLSLCYHTKDWPIKKVTKV